MIQIVEIQNAVKNIKTNKCNIKNNRISKKKPINSARAAN